MKHLFFIISCTVFIWACEKTGIVNSTNKEPQVFSVEKTNLKTGSILNIIGENFSEKQVENIISIDGKKLDNIILIKNILGSTLQTSIPVGAKSGNLLLTSKGKTIDLGNITIEEFNPLIDWEASQSFIGPNTPTILFKFKDKVIFSNQKNTDEFEMFSFDGNKWEKKNDIPFKMLYSSKSFSVNGMGYILPLYSKINGVFSNAFWEYNPNTDKWTKLSDFKGKARDRGIVFNTDNKAYYGLGMGENFKYLNDIWEFNASTKNWIQKNDFPYYSSFFGNEGKTLGSVDNSIYLNIYGTPNYYSVEYNSSSDSWTKKNIPNFAYIIEPNNYNKEIIGVDITKVSLGFKIPEMSLSKFNKETFSFQSFKTCPGSPRIDPVCFIIKNKIFVGLGLGYKDLWSYQL